jgi:predicted NUDIX family phosphoesterase
MQNKAKQNKVNKVEVETLKFEGFESAMHKTSNAENALADKLKAYRKKHSKMEVKAFIKQWVAFGVTIKKPKGGFYSAKWCGDIARAAGIKQRAAGGGCKKRGTKSPADVRKENIARVLRLALGLKMNAKETKAFLTGLAKH